MDRRLLPLLGIALALSFPGALRAQDAVPSHPEWTPRAGDRVLVDVSNSIVYLAHEDGEYLTLDGLTGQRRVVSYDGIIYNAATPERTWEVTSSSFERKGRSVTFGEGRFFRLSWPDHRDQRRGNETTAYGIHSHLSIQRMLQDKRERTGFDRTGTGHRSMGCILLSEEDLTLIQNTFYANGEHLWVQTLASVDPLVAFTRPAGTRPDPSWLGLLMQ